MNCKNKNQEWKEISCWRKDKSQIYILNKMTILTDLLQLQINPSTLTTATSEKEPQSMDRNRKDLNNKRISY